MKIAHHVKYSEINLARLATDVGMPEGRFTQKTVPHLDAKMKITEVKYFYPKVGHMYYRWSVPSFI